MLAGPVLLDADILSEVSRANPVVVAHARAYLAAFGRFTVTTVTVFERLRGYREAIRVGKPFQRQLQAFESLISSSLVLPFDAAAADVAATIWSACNRTARRELSDLLIASIAISRQIPLATRNRRHFAVLGKASGLPLLLVDWTKRSQRLP